MPQGTGDLAWERVLDPEELPQNRVTADSVSIWRN